MPDVPAILVLDASVLINIVAMDDSVEFMRLIGRRLVAESRAANEVTRLPQGRQPSGPPLAELLTANVLEVASLDESGLDLFQRLVGATPPDDLDDGEAGAIACAHGLAAGVVLDEKKALRIVRSQFPNLAPFSTIHLFQYLEDHQLASSSFIRKALHHAIARGRMRVPAPYRSWVLERS